MRIATWNVNSIRVRKDRLMAWLDAAKPDVLCLQETKTVDESFPYDEIRGAGYQVETWGQKTYNGVAILSRLPMTNIARGLADGGDDAQARLLRATVAGVTVIGVYVPNGSSVGSDKYAYKLEWLARLATYVEAQAAAGPVVLCGDMNVAPEDQDVWDPAAFAGEVLCSEPERAALALVLERGGLVDVVRHLHPSGPLHTWWDYRGMSFFRDRGVRIDHVFASPALRDRATLAMVDREQRKGDTPSDHAPVLVEFG